VKIEETKKFLLDILKQNKTVPMLIGKHGIGKSAITLDALKEVGCQKISQIMLAQVLPEDVGGMPQRSTTINKVEWLKPFWFDSDGLFFDELNRASSETLNAFMEIPLYRSIHGFKLDDKVRITIAINPDNGVYKVGDLDPALWDRVVPIEVEPDLEGWKQWAVKAGINDIVISFLTQFPENFCPNSKADKISPTPRGWERVSNLLELGYFEGKYTKGILGTEIAYTFEGYAKERFERVKIKDLINNYEKYGIREMSPEKQLDIVNQAALALNEKISKELIRLTLKLIPDLREEMKVAFVKKLKEDVRSKILNNKELTNLLFPIFQKINKEG